MTGQKELQWLKWCNKLTRFCVQIGGGRPLLQLHSLHSHGTNFLHIGVPLVQTLLSNPPQGDHDPSADARNGHGGGFVMNTYMCVYIHIFS
ncbi:unnamed protein product [Linum tenue]|uniref:Uncharacterized protein n=1 Tax=Linum tenue TaxID=586396 RepID=A0AAV0L366_9ROSI|nr:unnamed protein product [Linum tenue]